MKHDPIEKPLMMALGVLVTLFAYAAWLAVTT